MSLTFFIYIFKCTYLYININRDIYWKFDVKFYLILFIFLFGSQFSAKKASFIVMKTVVKNRK
jgi:hypothetical protein